METMVVEGQNKAKRLKFQDLKEDRISALPDCLLHEILSRLLSTKAAIRTGALSKRWKHVWTLVPSLYFYHYELGRPRSRFFSYIDKTLTQRRVVKVNKFVVFTAYAVQFESQVNDWIRYAIRCNVEVLNLTLQDTEFEAECVLGQFFFISSCFTDLKLEGCMLNPIGAICWKNLRSLSISNGKLDEDLIQNILSGSPLLETLVLRNCYGYRRLDITSKSVKNLVFSGYINFDNVSDYVSDIIKINAPNILSITIQDKLVLWKLLLVNVTSLVKADIDYKNRKTIPKKEKEKMLKGIIRDLRHVNELKIGVRCTKALSRLEANGFAFPSNMKFPVATYDTSDSDSSDSDTSDSRDSSDSDTSDSRDSSDSDSSDSDSSDSDTSDSRDSSDSDSSTTRNLSFSYGFCYGFIL